MRSRLGRVIAVAACLAALGAAVALGHEPLRPYVVTAIDYHFHDAHPTLPIAPGRDLVVSNEGRNVHNVTIQAVGYSHDVQPGDRIVIDDIASLLGSRGRYSMSCSYHDDRGMTGVIVVAD